MSWTQCDSAMPTTSTCDARGLQRIGPASCRRTVRRDLSRVWIRLVLSSMLKTESMPPNTVLLENDERCPSRDGRMKLGVRRARRAMLWQPRIHETGLPGPGSSGSICQSCAWWRYTHTAGDARSHSRRSSRRPRCRLRPQPPPSQNVGTYIHHNQRLDHVSAPIIVRFD